MRAWRIPWRSLSIRLDGGEAEGLALFEDAGVEQRLDPGSVDTGFGQHLSTVLAQAWWFERRLRLGPAEASVAMRRQVRRTVLEVALREDLELAEVRVERQLVRPADGSGRHHGRAKACQRLRERSGLQRLC